MKKEWSRVDEQGIEWERTISRAKQREYNVS